MNRLEMTAKLKIRFAGLSSGNARFRSSPASIAFYLLLGMQTSFDPIAVVQRLIREHRVAVVPGTTFGIEDGCSPRVSYGGLEPQALAEGIGRLVSGLRALGRA